MQEHVKRACQAMMDSLTFIADGPAGFPNLVETVLAERTARLIDQAATPFPPWVALPVLTCEALVGDTAASSTEDKIRLEAAYQTAAAWELGNAAAAHLDAWQDQDTEGALWPEIGPQRTVNLALGLIALSFRVLHNAQEKGLLPISTTIDLQRGFADTVLRMAQGQHTDLGDDLTLDEYRAVAAAKSGALFRLACWSGAVVAGAPAEVANRYAAFGETLGLVIQAWNDLYGLEGAMGKQDRGHQRTLPILAELALARRGRAEIDRPTASGLEEGGRLYAVMQATLLHHEAAEALARCPAAGRLSLFLDAYAPERFLTGMNQQEG